MVLINKVKNIFMVCFLCAYHKYHALDTLPKIVLDSLSSLIFPYYISPLIIWAEDGNAINKDYDCYCDDEDLMKH